jgi:poly-gamma-glutamate biosynthesis protein PgsC/CapC
MAEMLTLFIGCGLVLSLIFSEVLGVAAGGMVVPGYIALHMDKPFAVAVTIGVALLAYSIVKIVSGFAIIYGRRRTVLTILVAYILGFSARHVLGGSLTGYSVEMAVIGYIVPGLIAIWMDRQGLVETICVLTTASVMVRLIMILAMGGEMLS